MVEALGVSLDVSAVPTQAVGVGRFALDLAAVLAGRDDVALQVFCRRDDAPRWADATTNGERSASVRARAPSARPLRLLWEQARLGHLVDRAGVAVHHGPHYTMPERARVPCVVTIHDLTFFDHPEWHERTKVPVFRRAIRVASRRARALLCDSEHTADRLQELLRPSGRVFLAPLGVDLARFHPSRDEAENLRDRALVESLGVGARYVLFLGTLEPRKAVPELVAAFDKVAQRHGDLELVLAGRPGWGATEIQSALRTARSAERIILTGYVPDDAVPALLRCAAVVAYPAKEEGFGLPALEALACGAPLVTTSGTVMAKLAGNAALTAAPGSVEELTEALAASLDADGSDQRRRQGLEIASRYTWEASAQSHVEAYRWASGSG